MIVTERLVLRQWRDSDVDPFARLCADPEVMEFFPSTETYDQTRERVGSNIEFIDDHGWGKWAVEVPGVANFIGFIGLAIPRFRTDWVEVGWRLDKPYWGFGYASEGASAALAYGFDELGLDEIVSFTAVPNVRSQRVMQRIGMHHDPSDDFDHPNLPDGHWLRRHVLYSLARGEWFAESRRVAAPSADV